MTSTIDTLATWLGSHGAAPALGDEPTWSSAVDGMYREILDRGPDGAGGAHLAKMLADGTTPADARTWLAHSRESLTMRITSTNPFGGVVDRIGPLLLAVQGDDDQPADVIVLLEVVASYLAVLGRWPDPAGIRDQYQRRAGRDVRFTVEQLSASNEALNVWCGAVPAVAASVREAASTAQVLTLLYVLTVQHLEAAPRDATGARESVDDRLDRIERALTLLADRRP